MSELSKKKCVPCEGNIQPLPKEKSGELLRELDTQWMLIDDARLLARHFHFPNFKKTMEFVNAVAAIAEEEGHHPDMTVSYGDVGIELMTHSIGGLSENDFILAAKIDRLQHSW